MLLRVFSFLLQSHVVCATYLDFPIHIFEEFALRHLMLSRSTSTQQQFQFHPSRYSEAFHRGLCLRTINTLLDTIHSNMQKLHSVFWFMEYYTKISKIPSLNETRNVNLALYRAQISVLEIWKSLICILKHTLSENAIIVFMSGMNRGRFMVTFSQWKCSPINSGCPTNPLKKPSAVTMETLRGFVKSLHPTKHLLCWLKG